MPAVSDHISTRDSYVERHFNPMQETTESIVLSINSLNIAPKESLPPGAEEAWPTWSCLNRLRTGKGRCKTLMAKWGLSPDGQTACDCGQEQTMKHLLVCPLLSEPCTKEDLEALTPRGRECVEYWSKKV